MERGASVLPHASKTQLCKLARFQVHRWPPTDRIFHDLGALFKAANLQGTEAVVLHNGIS